MSYSGELPPLQLFQKSQEQYFGGFCKKKSIVDFCRSLYFWMKIRNTNVCFLTRNTIFYSFQLILKKLKGSRWLETYARGILTEIN